ncbi:ATP-binding protein, partial [Calothrix rhizosoleniae]|uniref:sensor histidine kinase n=1 Tax=Calothrix rhizosoleniae TaxID=888997 RepID=UPI00135670AC
ETENELWLNLGILCLLGVAITTVIGNQITNFIIYRIQYLTKATKRLADGDFTTRIKVNGNDEINVLAQGFNYMIKQLTERDRKIYHQVEELEETKNKLVRREREYSKTLEIKVQERTEELQDKNEQLKETLEQLKAAQTQIIAQEKLASLGSLTAGIAHEINTPIGIGVTAASVLEEKTNVLLQSHESGNMKRSELKKYLNTASQSSQMILGNLNRAAELIQSFKQVAVDQSSEERRVFNIKKYLEEILLQLQPKLNNTKHQINIQGSDYLSIDSYPGVFSQVITNLIMNSLIHAYDDLDSGNIIIKYYQEDTDFVLEYQDDGKGIADENLTKIFEPFFTTKRNQGGTGLGLHIIYNIVTQKLLGDIDCESCLGVGSKFIIKIPITV